MNSKAYHCARCGQVFHLHREMAGEKPRFCSVKCKQASHAGAKGYRERKNHKRRVKFGKWLEPDPRGPG